MIKTIINLKKKTEELYNLFYIFCFLLLSFSSCTKTWVFGEDKLAVCSIIQNDARFLKEWLEYHSLLGVDKFYIFDANSTDKSYQILNKYISENKVEYIPWISSLVGCSKVHEASTINHFIESYAKNYKWFIFLSPDEFINPKIHDNLKLFLSEYKHIGGIGVFNQKFGTSWIKELGKNQLITESFTHKVQWDDPTNRGCRYFLRPKRILRYDIDGLHMQDGYHTVDETHYPLSPHIVIDKIQINKYFTKDENTFRQYCQEKNFSDSYFHHMCTIFNKEEDASILRFSKDLRKRMGLPEYGYIYESEDFHEVDPIVKKENEKNREKYTNSNKDY